MKRNSLNEFDIIEQINGGDTSVFRLLVDKYKDVSFSLACSILSNEQDAEDALQESFIKAYNGLKRFKQTSSFSTWLYKIVVNTCMTRYQKQSKERKIIDANTDINTEISDTSSLFNEIVLNERKDIVNKVLESVKEEESLLLRLYYLADLSIAEIKEITGFSDSNIKVSLYRARKSLQKEAQRVYGHELNLTL
jgi:RNA polymerase sigma-70 factor, ECF subfamily